MLAVFNSGQDYTEGHKESQRTTESLSSSLCNKSEIKLIQNS